MGTPGEHCFCGDYLGGACDGCRWERDDDTAPKDGTEIELLIRHHNYTYCGNSDDRNKWQEAVRGKWIDHNGGGWTWMGICGHVMAWRPLPANVQGQGEDTSAACGRSPAPGG